MSESVMLKFQILCPKHMEVQNVSPLVRERSYFYKELKIKKTLLP